MRGFASHGSRAAAVFLAAIGVGGISAAAPEAYAPAPVPLLDTLRLKPAAGEDRSGLSHLAYGAVVPGYLSARGLPPVAGQVTLSDSGIVFRSVNGLPGPVRQGGQRRWRPYTISLAYRDESGERPAYVFRVDDGVFETERPGLLLDVAAHPEWLDTLACMGWTAEPPLVNPGDSLAIWSTTREISVSTYADTLYRLFGRPRAAVGLVGERGRRAGRLGEYIPGRDSLAIDPGRMSSQAQLRHAIAHELGHRWQARAPRQVATLWEGVAPIRDSKRYGHGNVSEHQAEAIAFAVSFLQTTAAEPQSPETSLTLLDHYELLVPGTRLMVRYLSLQPVYHDHPLRILLTTGR